MPRMFDILRGKEINSTLETKDAIPKNTTTNLTVSLRRNLRSIVNPRKNSTRPLLISKKLIDAVRKKDVDNPEVAKEKYDSALRMTETLLEKINKKESVDSYITEIYKVVDSLTNQLIFGSCLLENVAEDYITDDYLPRHITNVCILSLLTGVQIKLNKSKLHTLGIAAILHDIGLLGVREIIKEPRELSYEEFREVKNHTLRGAEAVSKLRGANKDIIKKTIEQHHERVNGKGYPSGLKGNEIDDYAKIIGLADTYEAMVHNRPYRQAKLSHQAILEIVSSFKLFFEPWLIKAFVDKLSIYPVGSFVKLNNGEIAKVVDSNSSSPLRPMVLVVMDSDLKNIPRPKILDLSKSDSTYIKEPFLLNKH